MIPYRKNLQQEPHTNEINNLFFHLWCTEVRSNPILCSCDEKSCVFFNGFAPICNPFGWPLVTRNSGQRLPAAKCRPLKVDLFFHAIFASGPREGRLWAAPAVAAGGGVLPQAPDDERAGGALHLPFPSQPVIFLAWCFCWLQLAFFLRKRSSFTGVDLEYHACKACLKRRIHCGIIRLE